MHSWKQALFICLALYTVYANTVLELFDVQGTEVMRIGGFIKTFHFQSVFDYVREKGYLTEPSFQRYIAARGERIREQGYDTNIWNYESSHR